MLKYFSKSIWLLVFSIVICCGIYPLALWLVGQAFFPFQANGSMLLGPDGQPVGSRLIAQPFTKDEYFQPRPSAASYDASASASSSLAASNYALRDRVAHVLGPIVKYRSGPKAGQPVGPDIESWFQQDQFDGKPGIVTQWADLHSGSTQNWVKGDKLNSDYVAEWQKTHPDEVAAWVKANPDTPEPKPEDLGTPFFESYAKEHPHSFPSAVEHKTAGGKSEKTIEPVQEGPDIQSTFFDMWRQDHADADLQDVPGDMVTASASGLDPDITLQNAEFQLDRVASKWAADLKRDPIELRKEIEQTLQKNAAAPLGGIAGEKFVNVLDLNLELRKHYGEPS